jgi:hypothetical protein
MSCRVSARTWRGIKTGIATTASAFVFLLGMVLPLSAAPTVANLWVDTNGGTCSRQSPASSYSDAAACGSFDAAWDAASVGDVIVVKAGTYGPQTISGNKISPGVTIYGETTTKIGNLTTNAAFMTLENVTVDVGSAHMQGWITGANNITLRNVKLHGLFVIVRITNDNITWDGGELGVAGQTGGARDFCGIDGEPVTLEGADNITFNGISFHPQATVSNSACAHMEMIRIDLGGSNFTLRNSTFDNGDGSSTASIFITNPVSGGTYNGFKLENNFFGMAESSYALMVHGNVATCNNWTFAYNTFKPYPAAWDGCRSLSGWLWVGNLGQYATSSPCAGTHIKNVWQHNMTGTCGSDKWVIGTAFSTSALGLGGTGGFYLQAGSPAIDAGETGGYCTSTLGSIDHDRNGRPFGTACDAGAHEFGSTNLRPAPASGLTAIVR